MITLVNIDYVSLSHHGTVDVVLWLRVVLKLHGGVLVLLQAPGLFVEEPHLTEDCSWASHMCVKLPGKN